MDVSRGLEETMYLASESFIKRIGKFLRKMANTMRIAAISKRREEKVKDHKMGRIAFP